MGFHDERLHSSMFPVEHYLNWTYMDSFPCSLSTHILVFFSFGLLARKRGRRKQLQKCLAEE